MPSTPCPTCFESPGQAIAVDEDGDEHDLPCPCCLGVGLVVPGSTCALEACDCVRDALRERDVYMAAAYDDHLAEAAEESGARW